MTSGKVGYVGKGIAIAVGGGLMLLCFGVFCLARARHLSRADVRTTSPVSYWRTRPAMVPMNAYRRSVAALT